MTKFFALLESPTQCTALVNYLNAKGIYDVDILIRYNGNASNDKQMDRILFDAGLKYSSYKAKPGSIKSIFCGLILCLALRLCLRKRFLLVGDWRARWIKLACRLYPNESVIVLDDGLATVNIIKAEAKRALQGHSTPRFATFFSFDADLYGRLVVEQLQLPGSSVERALSNNVVFAGTPLVEKGIINYKDWCILMRYMANKIGTSFTYIPHRAENTEIKRKFIESICGEIKPVDVPFEDYLRDLEFSPRKIISFYSTVLVSSIPFVSVGTGIMYIQIPEKFLAADYKDSINSVYEYFSALERLEKL